MILRKSIAHAIGGAALLLAAGGSHAASISVASASDTLGGVGTAATFSGGAGGTLFVPSAPGTAGIPVIITFDPSHSFAATFTFTPTSATSGATPIPGGDVAETFTGGTFDFSNGGTTYLTGTYSSGVMTTANHATTVQFQSGGANSVTYTGGTFLGLAGISPGAVGSFSLGFSGADTGGGTGVGVSGGFISPWTANGFSGTFSAFTGRGAVPEPSGLAGFAIAGILLAMAGVARKRIALAAKPV